MATAAMEPSPDQMRAFITSKEAMLDHPTGETILRLVSADGEVKNGIILKNRAGRISINLDRIEDVGMISRIYSIVKSRCLALSST